MGTGGLDIGTALDGLVKVGTPEVKTGTVAARIPTEIADDPATHAAFAKAITGLDAAIKSVDGDRAKMGATQNRLESTINNLANTRENVSAGMSRIKDVDFAQETVNLTKQQILQQAGTSILAQAKQIPQAALSLLG